MSGCRSAWGAVIAIYLCAIAEASLAQTVSTRIDDALQNITTLARTGRVGYATFWDGNKYIQCRRLTDRNLRCEAAGTSLQPSLKSVLTGERLNRLASLDWILDPSFGNYVHTFLADIPTSRAADHIQRTLAEVYGADVTNLEIRTAWVVDIPCPPRNGPTQNLAGIVNDSAAMRANALLTCSYTPTAATPQSTASSEELIALYGATVTAEIQRLRINRARRVFAVFSAGIGYVQCGPDGASAIYCEAQSTQSWPALTAVLTPERISLLHQAGYSDPGRVPNYWKNYPINAFNDTAIASEILTILHKVYGYTSATKLKISTE